MSRDEIPQSAALRLQLTAIVGSEPHTSFVELRPFTPNMEPAPRAFVPVSDIDGAIGLIGEQAPTLHAYVGVCPRIRESGRTEDIERCWTLWADLDGKAALKKLAAFEPLPAIVIRSGSEDAAHAYWPLNEPLAPAWAQRANRRLALALEGDRNATDPARILRPAGTLNHKHAPARPVVCTRLETDVFSWAEVAGSLPDDRAYVPPSRPAARPVAGDPSKLLAGLARVVADAQEGNRNAALFWSVCQARDHDEAGEIDLHAALDDLRDAATHVGLPHTEIERTIASGLAAGKNKVAS